MDEPTEVTAVALVADLMFASRVRGAAGVSGANVVTVNRAERVMEEARRLRPRLVLIDLETRGTDFAALIGQLKADPETASARVIAFGPHVNGDALIAARDAGADRVLARSAFMHDLPALLGGTNAADGQG